MSQQEEEVFVDPSSMTVAIQHGEMVILPVDCDPQEWCDAVKHVIGLHANPLPDGRVLVRRD